MTRAALAAAVVAARPPIARARRRRRCRWCRGSIERGDEIAIVGPAALHVGCSVDATLNEIT